MSTKTHLFVVFLILANILGCLWLLWWTARMRGKTSRGGTKAEPSERAKTVHVLGNDPEEHNNPLPSWWLGLFALNLLLGIGYLVYFPGLSEFKGTRGRTPVIQRAAADVGKARASLEQRLAKVKVQDLHALARDGDSMRQAANLFAANCSTCHGTDARGAFGSPNLTDADWLWGSEEIAILTSISSGRYGTMPAFSSVLGDAGVSEVAAYVLSLSGRQASAHWVAADKSPFQSFCAACHGADGRGNHQLGAPNLTDDIWLHGGDLASIRTTIASGRTSQMPAYGSLLGATKTRLLAAFMLSISEPQYTSAAQPDLTEQDTTREIAHLGVNNVEVAGGSARQPSFSSAHDHLFRVELPSDTRPKQGEAP